jgi:hypothetical protein
MMRVSMSVQFGVCPEDEDAEKVYQKRQQKEEEKEEKKEKEVEKQKPSTSSSIFPPSKIGVHFDSPDANLIQYMNKSLLVKEEEKEKEEEKTCVPITLLTPSERVARVDKWYDVVHIQANYQKHKRTKKHQKNF